MKIPLVAWFIRIIKWILIGVYFFVAIVFLIMMIVIMYGGIVEIVKTFL